jgi:hypothetical protein
MKTPTLSILNPRFKYTPAVSTDITKTFARVRAEQRQVDEEDNLRKLYFARVERDSAAA